MTNTETPSNLEEGLVNQEKNKPLRDELGRLLPGHTANPNGRPKGKTLKEFQAEQFRMMSDEEKAEWLKDVAKDTRWKMSEGMPKADVELSGKLSISNVLNELENGGHETPVEGVENPAPIQNQEQAAAVSEVQAESSTDPLQSAQVVKEFNP